MIRLPQYRESPESPYNTPELTTSYPYILITGKRLPGFFHTENRQVPCLRELHRDPIVDIHPETAKKEGINEGDWVVIESPRGKIRHRARLFLGLDPGLSLSSMPGGFPKRETQDTVGRNRTSTFLTDNSYKSCDPAMGASSVRTLLCRIYPEKA